MREYHARIYVAEIPAAWRKPGLQWLVVEDNLPTASTPDYHIAVLYIIGPRELMKTGPHPGEIGYNYGSLDDASIATESEWGVGRNDWIEAPDVVDLHGTERGTADVLRDSAFAASFRWKPLEKPNSDGHCVVCIHIFDEKGEQFPTTHVVDGPPLPGNRGYVEICPLCYARFIARPGVTELMEQLLRSGKRGPE